MTWTEQKGVKGFKIESKKNSRYIFLPAGGAKDESVFEPSCGYYWSSSLQDSSYPYCAYFVLLDSGNFWKGWEARSLGFFVRAVLD